MRLLSRSVLGSPCLSFLSTAHASCKARDNRFTLHACVLQSRFAGLTRTMSGRGACLPALALDTRVLRTNKRRRVDARACDGDGSVHTHASERERRPKLCVSSHRLKRSNAVVSLAGAGARDDAGGASDRHCERERERVPGRGHESRRLPPSRRIHSGERSIFLSDGEHDAVVRSLLARAQRACEVCGEQGWVANYGLHGLLSKTAPRMLDASCAQHALCTSCFETLRAQQRTADAGAPSSPSRSDRHADERTPEDDEDEDDPRACCPARTCDGVFLAQRVHGARPRSHGDADAFASRVRRRHAAERVYGAHGEHTVASTCVDFACTRLRTRENTPRPTLTDVCPSCASRVWAAPRELCAADVERALRADGADGERGACARRLRCSACDAEWCLRCGAIATAAAGDQDMTACGACLGVRESALPRAWSRYVRTAGALSARESAWPARKTESALCRAVAVRLSDALARTVLVRALDAQIEEADDVAAYADPIVRCGDCAAPLSKATACNELQHCRSVTCNACGAHALPWERGLPSAHWRAESPVSDDAADADAGADADRGADDVDCKTSAHTFGRGCARWNENVAGVLCADGLCKSQAHDCALPAHADSRAALTAYRRGCIRQGLVSERTRALARVFAPPRARFV